MRKNIKRIFSSILVLAMLFTTSVSASAVYSSDEGKISENVLSFDGISDDDKIFLTKMTQIFDGFVINSDGIVSFTYTDAELTQIFGFTKNEISKLNQIVETTVALSANTGEYPVAPAMFVEDGIVYFDNADIHAFLLAAASAGPAAVYAAIVALGSVTLGPVGTAIAAIVGVIGAPSLASFCYYVVQAAINNQGVYLGVEMNGIFPNIICGTWG